MTAFNPVSVEPRADQIDTGSDIATRRAFVPHVSGAPGGARAGRNGYHSGVELRRPTFKSGSSSSAGSNGAVSGAEANALLAERLCRKEHAALEELYDRASGKAFGLAYRVLGDGPAAEDVVQDVFLWVWDHTDRIDAARGNVESLLMTLVHRRSIDALRARSRREALPVSSITDAIDESASDMVEKVAASITREEVARAMKDLNPDQRSVIEQAYFKGMTQREISEETGLPIGTVKSRMRLGIDRLRSAFGIGGAR